VRWVFVYGHPVLGCQSLQPTMDTPSSGECHASRPSPTPTSISCGRGYKGRPRCSFVARDEPRVDEVTGRVTTRAT